MSARLAVVVEVLEQLLAGQVAAAPDDARQRAGRAIDDRRGPRRSCRGSGSAPRARPMLDVAVAQRGQAEGAVGRARTPRCRRGSASSPAGARRSPAPCARGRPGAPQVGGRRARGSPAARAPKAIMRVVLGLVAHLAPARVVAVLLAPARVAAGGLDVAVGVRADPDVGPGRRDRQLADPLQGRGIAHRLAVGILDRELGTQRWGPCRIFLRSAGARGQECGGRRRGAGRRHAPRRPDRSPARGSLHAPLLAAPRSQPRREPKDHYRPRLAVAGCWLPVYRVGRIPIICDPPDGRRHLVEQHGVVGGTTNGGRRVRLETQQNRHVA